ncbi:MAG TPA: hypothetical protein VIG54_10085, partial [Lysobacter sp.]
MSPRARRAGGIDLVQRFGQHLAQFVVVPGDRQAGRVVDLPDLVAVAQRLVAHHLVGEVDPGLRAAGEAMDHQQDAAVGIEALHAVDVRLAQPAGSAQQRQRGLPRERRLGQPHAVAGGEVRGERQAAPAQLDVALPVGIEGVDGRAIGREHLGEVAAGEIDHRRQRQEAHARDAPRASGRLGRGGVADAVGGELHRHLRAEAVAAERGVQAAEAQAVGGNQPHRHGFGVLRRKPREIEGQRPAARAQLHHAVARLREPVEPAFGRAQHDVLHGDVVVVAHVVLARLEHPRVGRTFGQEQVAVGIARDVEPGRDRGVAVARFVAAADAQRAHARDLGQRRQPRLVAERLGAAQA